MASKWQHNMTDLRHIGCKLGCGLVSLAGWLGFRERYILTKHRVPRIRYLIMPAAFMLAIYGADTIAEARLLDPGYKSGLQYSDISAQIAPVSLSVNAHAGGRAPQQDSANNTTPRLQPELQSHREDGGSTKSNKISRAHIADNGIVTPPATKPRPESITRTRTIGKGDTMAGILASAGMTRKEAYRAVKAMKQHYNPRALKPGQNVSIRLKPDKQKMDVTGFRVSIDPVRMLRVARTDRGDFKARFQEKSIRRELHAKQIHITGSLYGSASRNKIPASIISKAIHVFSWDIDFQRDLKRGDTLKILYARHVTEDGIYTGNGTVIYAALNMRGHKFAAYRYKKRDGDVGYYKPNGHSVRKALMTTPVDGARISSGYGKRKHPVLGYSKMHEGVDFAAPTGTPVYAAGDGVIERASRYGGYGNYIRMRHNARLKTAYAHLNRYAEGIDPGQRVEQGEVIGYIGSTGRSTGPHLHYEVMKRGEPVNPENLDMPTGEILQGKTLKRFQKRVGEIKVAYSTHKGEMKYAARSGE